MIRNQWYVVLESKEIKAGKPVGVTRMGEKLVFWRDSKGQLSCLRDLCPHRGAAMSIGAIKGNCIECPFHGFQYDVTGQCQYVPSNGKNAPLPKQIKIDRYLTYEAKGFVYIYYGDSKEEPSPPKFFDNMEGMSYTTMRSHWDTHYSRAIENQLDVAHVPFVHRTTIGRGAGKVIDGPFLEWVGEDRFKFYPFYRQDDGKKVLRPDEVEKPNSSFWLEFIFPNLWQNHLGDNSAVVIAFVPVDDLHTLMYLRFYQKFISIPILRELVGYLSIPLNQKILNQDKHVVLTQLPKRTELKIGEKLVPADRPIVEYRARRKELSEAALAISKNS